MALLDFFKSSNQKKGSSQNGTTTKKPASTYVNKDTGSGYVSSYKPTPTVNGIPKNNPASTGNAYADALRSATVNGTRANGAFNSGATTKNPVTGDNTTVTGNSYNSWKNWEEANTKNTDNKKDYGKGGGVNPPVQVPAPAPSGPSLEDLRRLHELGERETEKNKKKAQMQSEIDDLLAKIKARLGEGETRLNDYYKSLYEQALTNSKQTWEDARDAASRRMMRTDRYLKNLYGSNLSGSGLSNFSRNYTQWNNSLNALQRERNMRDAESLGTYNKNLGEVANYYSNALDNYVLPVYTNRLNNLEEAEQQLKMYDMQLANNLKLNDQNLAYRLKANDQDLAYQFKLAQLRNAGVL